MQSSADSLYLDMMQANMKTSGSWWNDCTTCPMCLFSSRIQTQGMEIFCPSTMTITWAEPYSMHVHFSGSLSREKVGELY